MAKRKEKLKAIELRKQGKSYSEIRKQVNVSKGTLSSWLRDYPLSKKDLERLRDNNPVRIEKCRETKRKKREARHQEVEKRVTSDFRKITERELLIAGLFLYWAEGTKRARYTTALANTDPSMIRFFLHWLSLLKVPRSKITVRLQLYSDMNVKKEREWWQNELSLSKKHFRKPYIKKTTLKDLSYREGYGHGTCNILVHDRDLQEYVIMGVRHLQEINSTSVEFNKT